MPAQPPVALPPLPTRRTSKERIPINGLLGEDLKPYIPDEGLLAAANAAIALDMPLLLTGEPGCGKTDFAHAIANYLDRRRESKQGIRRCHVRSDTRARDLLYQYDALRRFGDAQHGDPNTREDAKDPRHYIELQPLGLALIAPIRQVVLIDEIDKAPRDLPNDLLRELERGVFEIPEIPASPAVKLVQTKVPEWGAAQRPIERQMAPPKPEKDAPEHRPIIVITSNVERQLPDAFLRRCVFYHIGFPDDKRLTLILRERHKDRTQHAAHSEVPNLPGDAPYLDYVVLFKALRDQPGLHKKPSTAELLAWVDVLGETYEPEDLRARMKVLAADIDPTAGKLKTHKWSDVPALSCLIKLREDLVTLG